MKRLLSIALALAFLGAIASSSVAQAETLTAGNGTYSVYVDSETGQYTVTTGPSHPLGAGLNVLYGNGSPGTSFDTVHSFTSNENYVLSSSSLTSTTVPIGTTGFKTTYTITAPDKLTIVQTIQVKGTTFNDSFVDVTTETTNNNSSPVQIGTRYLWDYQINRDDGPIFQANEPNGPVLFNETAFPSPTFNHYTVEDNDVSPEPPTFDVIGTVAGPASAAPVPPTLLQYASWPESTGTSFFYTPSGAEVANSAGSGNDSAVLYYWGDSAANGPTLAAGGTYRASASMFLTPPGAGLPGTPPIVTITSGPPKETTSQKATFTFKGVKGGIFECSIDNKPFAPCSSGQTFSGLKPGDHLFQVRETLAGVTGPAASYRWTIALPKACVLRVARARVFVFTKKHKVRLVIHYTSYRPAKVTVSYKALGKKGKLTLGSASAKFKKAGVFRLPEKLTGKAIATVRGAKLFKVHFKIAKTPKSCGAFYTKQLTIPKRISGQTVWFQSDSAFAP